jgi:hypothetical protein
MDTECYRQGKQVKHIPQQQRKKEEAWLYMTLEEKRVTSDK